MVILVFTSFSYIYSVWRKQLIINLFAIVKIFYLEVVVPKVKKNHYLNRTHEAMFWIAFKMAMFWKIQSIAILNKP